MPLDTNLFADLERLVITHRALTYTDDTDDPRCFSVGTPRQVESIVTLVWGIIPDERIICDCNRWAGAYKVVENKGAVVRGWKWRTGHRAAKKSEQPDLPTQFHPDAQDGVQALLELA